VICGYRLAYCRRVPNRCLFVVDVFRLRFRFDLLAAYTLADAERRSGRRRRAAGTAAARRRVLGDRSRRAACDVDRRRAAQRAVDASSLRADRSSIGRRSEMNFEFGVNANRTHNVFIFPSLLSFFFITCFWTLRVVVVVSSLNSQNHHKLPTTATKSSSQRIEIQVSIFFSICDLLDITRYLLQISLLGKMRSFCGFFFLLDCFFSLAKTYHPNFFSTFFAARRTIYIL
jgi:hypothetical protein